MEGKNFRLERFLSRSKKLVIAAIDHGAFMGPIEGLENLKTACAHLSNADAILMSPGIAEHIISQFTEFNGPQLIIRLSWNSNYCCQWNYNKSFHRPLLTAANALAKGADLFLASLALNTGNEQTDADNVEIFSDYVQQAHGLGIPIIGEYYPVHAGKMLPTELHENIRIGCRIVAELGADMIKTFYTGSRFHEIVESTPIPIFVLGAKKTPTETEALRLAGEAAAVGARGIIFGRNIVQSSSPARFIKAVRAVMNDGITPEEALQTYEPDEILVA